MGKEELDNKIIQKTIFGKIILRLYFLTLILNRTCATDTEKLVYVPYGSAHQFSPCSDKEWKFCSWSNDLGESCETASNPVSQPRCNIRGGSWLEGCTLQVRNMTASKEGAWVNTMMLREQEFVECVERISIAYPAKVSMSKLPYSMIVGKVYAVHCTADSAKPVPKITAFVKTINETRWLEEAAEDSGTERVKVFTYKPVMKDAISDNIEIWCDLKQDLGYDVLKHDAALTSTVIFPPQKSTPLQANATLNESVSFNIVVRSKPLPRPSDIAWHFVSSNMSQSFKITSMDKFEDYIIQVFKVDEQHLNITMHIRNLSEDDLSYHQYIRVKNEAGSTDYTIHINRSDIDDGFDDESSALGHLILAFSVFGLLAFVLGVSFLLNAKATGKWCFAPSNKNLETEIILEPKKTSPEVGDTSKLVVVMDPKNGASPPIEVINEESPIVERKTRREILHSKSRSPSPPGGIKRSSFRRSSSRKSTSSAVQGVKKVSVTSRESTYPVQ